MWAAPPHDADTVLPRTVGCLIARYKDGERWFEGLNLPPNSNLRGANLQDLWAPGADLADVDLTGADLTRANLEGAVLRGAKCADTIFAGGARLDRADLTGAKFQGSKNADLTGAILKHAELSRTDLRDAVLRDADLYGATALDGPVQLERADLRGAHLSAAKLPRANLSGALFDKNTALSGTDLTGANLGAGLHARFDKTHTRNLVFTSTLRGFLTASPLWLQLRSSYTGVWMAVHLVLVGAFVLPHILEAAFWRAASSGQLAALRIVADTTATDTSRQAGLRREGDTLVLKGLLVTVTDSLRRMADRTQGEAVRRYVCIKPPCTELPLWKVLVGWDRDWWVRVGLILAYVSNLIRLVLTLMVSMFRDREALTGRSPGATTCWWLGVGHWVFRILILYVAGSGILHIVQVLQQPVQVPD